MAPICPPETSGHGGIVEGPLVQATPLVVCGPSGVGKGTVISHLLAADRGRYAFSVSHTTRAPRPGETDGEHYHFTDKATMQRDIDSGKFLEYAHVHGNIYGTSLAAVEKVQAEGKICILDIDVQGAENVKRSGVKALYVFISSPSMEELERRLRGRGTEKEESILKRLRNAAGEIEKSREPGFFDRVIVNHNVETCGREIRSLLATSVSGAA